MQLTRRITSFVSFPHSTREDILAQCALDDPETFWNAPVSLQLVGRAQEEEAVIAMTEIVDAALKEQVAPKL